MWRFLDCMVGNLRGPILAAAGLALAGPGPAAASDRHAAVVVDVQSGRLLHAVNPDAPRYPASLVKIMTLYLLFEDLEAGRIAKTDRMPVSARAARQPPSKLGLKAGAWLRVDDAIRALVTKSANDAAVVVAERLSGSEEAFARRMTAKARALGMSRTVFRNASGLPHSGQRTTARDLARLGVAIQQHFPAHYKYFAVRSFRFGRRAHANHNRLLGRVAGLDGIKTGYTNASGFNLVASVRRDGRHLVAVVLGERSGRMRDAHMQGLIDAALTKASAHPTNPVRIARAPRDAAADAVAPPRYAALAQEPEARALPPLPPAVRPRVKAGAARPARPTKDEGGAAGTVGLWLVQVGVARTEFAAETLLDSVRSKTGDLLSSAAPMTEKVEKGDKVFYRARFAGFDRKTAAMVCRTLKRNDLACFATLN